MQTPHLFLALALLVVSCSRASNPVTVTGDASGTWIESQSAGPRGISIAAQPLSAPCGDAVIEHHGDEIKRYRGAACDPAFVACFDTCGRSYGPGSMFEIQQVDGAIDVKDAGASSTVRVEPRRPWDPGRVVACADECDRQSKGRKDGGK